MIKNQQRHTSFILMALFLALAVGCGWRPAMAATGDRFIYFDPDSAQGNLAPLKDELNSFLQRADLNLRAQPVARIDAFEALAAQTKAGYMVVPRWYLETEEAAGLTPLLTLLDNGSQSFRKLVVARKDSKLRPEDLKKKPVAMATVNRQAARQLLKRTLLVPYGLDKENPHFLFTPRDYDSFIALLLGKVEAAVVAQRSLDRLQRINPALVKRLKIIGRSKPIPTPVLCRLGANGETDKVVRAFLDSKDSGGLQPFMEMLGFNGWVKFKGRQAGEVRR